MKKENRFPSAFAALIIALLVTMAFVPEKLQLFAYIGIFALGAIWLTKKHILPWLGRIRDKVASFKRHREIERTAKSEGFTVYDVLLKHASYRITGFLKASYPDATWSWCYSHPESMVALGGKGRIQVYGIDEYNFCEVTFDRNADMKCSLIKVVPMDEKPSETVNPESTPTDPQIWFDLHGREVLESVISELNAYGHRKLTIRENGDITITQADKEITKRHLESYPEKSGWSGIVKALERFGVAGEATDDVIVVTW